MAGKRAREGRPLYVPPPGSAPLSFQYLPLEGTTPDGKPSESGDPANPPLAGPVITPPFVALLMEPFSRLHWELAYLVWRIVTALACIVALIFSLDLAGEKKYLFAQIAIGVGVLTAFFPFKEQLQIGQIDCLTILTWVMGTWFFMRNRPAASSLFFVIGAAVKVTPILVVPLMLMRRQWRWLASYALWGLAILGLSIWSLGWENHVIWATRISPLLSCGDKFFANRSLPGLVLGVCNPRELVGSHQVSTGICLFNKALSALCLLGFLGWSWTKRKDAGGLAHELVLMTLVCLLLSPISWRQHYILAVLPLVYFWVKTAHEANKLEIGLVSVATLVFGIALPEYIAPVLGPFFELLVMALWVGSAGGLIWLGMRMYDRCVPSLQPPN